MSKSSIRIRLTQLERRLSGGKGDVDLVKWYVGECNPDSWDGESMPRERQEALIKRGRRLYLALTIDEGLEYGIERQPDPPPEEGSLVETLEQQSINPFAGELSKESKPIPEEIDPLQVRITERLLHE